MFRRKPSSLLGSRLGPGSASVINPSNQNRSIARSQSNSTTFFPPRHNPQSLTESLERNRSLLRQSISMLSRATRGKPVRFLANQPKSDSAQLATGGSFQMVRPATVDQTPEVLTGKAISRLRCSSGSRWTMKREGSGIKMLPNSRSEATWFQFELWIHQGEQFWLTGKAKEVFRNNP